MTENLPVITDETQLALQSIDPNSLGDLQEAEAAPVDLMSDYWTPESVGESRRVYFDRIQPMVVVDVVSQQGHEMDCAFFFYRDAPEAPYRQIRNGSKRLVGAIQAFNLPRMTPLEIKYLGKKRNKNNAFLSDNWQITPLRINVPAKQ